MLSDPVCSSLHERREKINTTNNEIPEMFVCMNMYVCMVCMHGCVFRVTFLGELSVGGIKPTVHMLKCKMTWGRLGGCI